MNKIFSILVAFVMLTTFAYSVPKLEIEGGTTYDWGRVKPEDNPLKATVKLWNRGDTELHIPNVKPGCGCTTAPLDTNYVAPGKYATLQITLNISSTQGPTSKAITIYTNEPGKETTILYLKANIVRPINMFPNNLFFNRLIVNETGTAKINLQNNTQTNINFNKIVVSDPRIKLNIKEGMLIKPNETFTIEATLTPDVPGKLNFNISIITDNKEIPTIDIRGWGNVIDKNNAQSAPVQLNNNNAPVKPNINVETK